MKRDKKIIIGIFALISIVVIYQTAQAGLLDQLLGGQTDTPVDKIDKPINIDTNITKTPVNKDVARLSSDYLKQDFNSKYGSIAVTDSIDKVVEYTLNYNSDFCLTSCSARGKATLYKDGSLFDDVYFTNKFGQKITIPDYRVYLIDYKTVDNFIPIWTTSCMDVYNITTGKNNNVCTPYITGFNNQPSKIEIPTQYNGEVLTAGNYEWKITGKKKSYETIDWIAISNNQQLKEWGWWNASYSIKKQVNITGVGMSGLTSPNFTVFIRVPYASPMNLNYTDVTFSDTTETSELHFDRDYTNSTEMGVWVEIPNMTTGVNSIYMLYNSTVTNDRQNRPNAWDKEQAVRH